VHLAGGEQGDAGREEDDGRDDDERRDEQAKHCRRRPAAHVLLASQVVGGEAPGRAPGLQHDHRYEQDAQEDVRRRQAADEGDRRALGGEQHQQHGSRRCRKPGVSFGRHVAQSRRPP